MVERDQGFQTPWWLGGSHIQTIAPSLDPRWRSLGTEHVRHELPDGDFLDLHWLGRERTGPLVIVLPGMQGSERSTCVRSLLGELERRGVRAVVLCHRGATVPNRRAASYHAGFIDHLAWLVARLRATEPRTTLHGVGFSLGGSMLIRYLSEAGRQGGLRSGAAVSLTFDLSSTATRACQGFNRIYQRRVLRSYQRVTRLKAGMPELASRLPQMERARSIREFDEVISAPLHGFRDAEDYYRRCSSTQDLPRLEVPFLILNAVDDPLVAAETVPDARSLRSHVQLELTPRGGHLGFLGRRRDGFGYYAPSRLIPFLLQDSNEAHEPLSAHAVGDDLLEVQAGHAGRGAGEHARAARAAQ